MRTYYGLYDMQNHHLIGMIETHVFHRYCHELIGDFQYRFGYLNDSQTKQHVKEFIHYYNQRYFVPGKQYNMVVNPTNLTKTCFQKPSESLVLVRESKQGRHITLINPAQIYYDYQTPAEQSTYYHLAFNHVRHHPHTQGRKHAVKGSYRSSLNFERWYAQQADTRFNRYLAQPHARKPENAAANSKWDAWELEQRSEMANWKTQTKDKYQWQHNLRRQNKKQPTWIDQHNSLKEIKYN